MIHIFCGEDSVSSRKQYLTEIEKQKKAGVEVLSISPSQIVDLNKGLGNNLSLFSSTQVYIVEGLEKAGFRKSTKAKKDSIFEAIVALSTDKTIEVLDWEEDKPSRILKLKDIAKVTESKPTQSVFKLLDLCIPKNKIAFIVTLREVLQTQADMLVFVLLFRHIRQLVLIQSGEEVKIAPWQKYKLHSLASKWEKDALLHFYEGLIKIEFSTKSGENAYGIGRSLEILACYYL